MAWVNGLATGWEILLAIAATLYAFLSGLLFFECLVALISRQQVQTVESSLNVSFAILIPAHNEASVIKGTLTQLLPQVDSPEQIVVVADNCHDETAAVARSTGVKVLERQDPSRRGKGYALDYGLHALANTTPPEVVVMVDADCWVSPGTIHHIVQAAKQSGHPIQAVYRMELPPEPSLRDRLSAFAFIVKNRVRAGGLSQLGVPIMLGGTGMAFPWQALQSVELASGHIVEDMKLGIDLAISGYISTISLESEVLGVLPNDEAAATSQRTRWEHGKLQVLTTYVPRLLSQAIRQLRLDLFILAVDLAIPPLALWAMIGISLTAVTSFSMVLGIADTPFLIQIIADILLASSILLAWAVWGRKELSFSQLIAVPSYILWKIPLYLKAVIAPQKNWIRTKRNT
ncbi:MAG: glycosyltransferase family 2 protein [Cyanobacteria bacterium P01_F01_bin.86]